MDHSRVLRRVAAALAAFLWTALGATAASETADRLHDPRETHLADVRQLTFGGENAEAYWSPDGTELIFQARKPPHGCDQIFRMKADGSGEPVLVSTGEGRTTCAYFFYPNAERILYSSTHAADPACPPPADHSQGYVWPIYSTYEIYTALPDGSDLVRLTDNDAYDAEATLCPTTGKVIFTSTRGGDLDLYTMNLDSSEVTQITGAPGYDGGAFFSADCSKIVWRASRPRQGKELDDYRRLLAEGLVRPSKMEIWVAEADGSDARQLTYFGAGSFAPYFQPSGDRVIFSSNFGSGSPREFDMWAIDIDGTDLERITYAPQFDGFPMFSPDGSMLAFASNRNQAKPGETDVYVARWVEHPPAAAEPSAADRYLAEVRWLADDARQGRGLGTEALEEAAEWLAGRFAEIGLAPAGGDGFGRDAFLHAFEAPVAVEQGANTSVSLDGEALAAEAFTPASFSASTTAEAEVVAAGYGITAPDLEVDDYEGIDATGKIVAVRRFTPATEAFEETSVQSRLSDLRYKAFNAREHGAVGMIVVDLPEVAEGEEVPDEAPLPQLAVDTRGDAGLPVAIVSREVGASLFKGGHRAHMTIEISTRKEEAHNVVGKVEADAEERLEGALVIGAHYDHLGLGGRGSLAPDLHEPHNGADDNASGTAALLEIARHLVPRRDELRRDVYLVAFSGEESGLLGSSALVRSPPAGLEADALYAMINLDMIGRLRDNRVAALGSGSAEEWNGILEAACGEAGVECTPGGDGYGPSDQTPFFAAGVPVLHFFTGTHDDYHKPSDDTGEINAVGGARIAGLVADLGVTLGTRAEPLTYKEAPAPPSGGDRRSYGAYLGTVPDYAAGDEPGVLLAGTREGSPAREAGFERGDRLVALGEHEIRDIYDFVFVLRNAKPGDTVNAAVIRGGERVELSVTFGRRGE